MVWKDKNKCEQIDVTEDAFFGTRDRSWGVRPGLGLTIVSL
ncbi:MAG: hypothetical protein Ct9H90mP6_04860 [Gammaproteobacteria bacterium]|nr:MAG: hypothetical protein Ct9H90mP6_04860 [Gammaproteobacteria bacterium]